MGSINLIYAHGINSGGGLVLLKEVIAVASKEDNYKFILDERVKSHFCTLQPSNVCFFSGSFWGRIQSEYFAWKIRRSVVGILSLNSLPFVLPLGVRTTVFFQNVTLLSSGGKPSAKGFLRKLLFKVASRNVDEFIVQTNSVASLALFSTGKLCKVKTLLDSALFASLGNTKQVQIKAKSNIRFIYVADGEAHKNHINLFAGWRLLKKVFPASDAELIVTLPLDDFGVWQSFQERYDNEELQVRSIGIVARDDLFKFYNSCDALLYPSLCESFGLPLLEAASHGLDIIASELDYVRDVVSPNEVFNPHSEVSIARAIARYLGLNWPSSINPVSASELLSSVFESDQGIVN